ncbi:MAG: hypothetical protein M1142_04865 [Patescibacteria group bacterium]|nr:hypothetical protein [Patescibacteria group bacterium]
MNKRKSLSKLILLMLEKAVDGYVRFEDFAYNPGFYVSGMREVNKSALANALKRLRDNGFVELICDKELALRLADTGRSKALWIKMKLEDEKWDGKWRLVIWDIPEKRRNARDLLRYQLKQLGFKKFQQSVWASKKNCTFLLREYIKKVGIEDWVKVVESDELSV